jgi:hypothetical protein
MQKLIKHFIMAVTLASVAFAQTSATKPAAKPAPATTSKSAAAPHKTAPAPAKTAAPAPAKPAAAKTAAPAPMKSAAAPAPKMAPKAAAPMSTPAKPVTMKEAKPKAEKPVASTKYSSRRDPFVNPVKMRQDKMATTAACTTGAKCLMIDQVVLKGVVKTQQGMIAMVENSAKKQYNLREKDPVYNGFVLKITGDSVVFKENATDNSGRPTTREVVKRVTVPVV